VLASLTFVLDILSDGVGTIAFGQGHTHRYPLLDFLRCSLGVATTPAISPISNKVIE
jgi:hypothetical protein